MPYTKVRNTLCYRSTKYQCFTSAFRACVNVCVILVHLSVSAMIHFYSLFNHIHTIENVVLYFAALCPQVTSHPVLVVFITVISHRWCLVIKSRSWNCKCQIFCKTLCIETEVEDIIRQQNMHKVQTCISSQNFFLSV